MLNKAVPRFLRFCPFMDSMPFLYFGSVALLDLRICFFMCLSLLSLLVSLLILYCFVWGYLPLSVAITGLVAANSCCSAGGGGSGSGSGFLSICLSCLSCRLFLSWLFYYCYYRSGSYYSSFTVVEYGCSLLLAFSVCWSDGPSVWQSTSRKVLFCSRYFYSCSCLTDIWFPDVEGSAGNVSKWGHMFESSLAMLSCAVRWIHAWLRLAFNLILVARPWKQIKRQKMNSLNERRGIAYVSQSWGGKVWPQVPY